MSNFWHKVYLWSMSGIVIAFTLYVGYYGYGFYSTPIEERFYHPQYDWFKPSGIFGHGMGIVGTILILFGVVIYIARKNYGFLEHYIRIKHMLEFHIFLCTLGPIMILFHTTFKFGGIVSVAFWSMVAVVLSGVVGRYIYLQIPRSIEGNELSLHEIQEQQKEMMRKLKLVTEMDQQIGELLLVEQQKKTSSAKLKISLKQSGLTVDNQRNIIKYYTEERDLGRKIVRLQLMQRLFKYWHVVHRPFALIMLVIVVVHVIITVLLGYKWIWS